jgi:asparagine synthase (glutamine-hydrolysing)
VPVGAFLSGGLDSTTIVALMRGQSPQPVRTYAVGFGELIDELPFARAAADRYRTEHHEVQMAIDVPACLARMVDVYDEPFGDSSNIPTYLVAEYARRHVKVVLSGDGGDEVFGGYSWYAGLLGRGEGRVTRSTPTLRRPRC